MFDLYTNNFVFEVRDNLSRGLIAVKDVRALLLSDSQWAFLLIVYSRLFLDSSILEHSQIEFL